MKLPSSSFIFSSSLILLSSLLLLGKSTARVPLQLIEFISLINKDVAVLISGAFSFNLIICRRLGGSSFNKCSFSRLIYNSEALKQLSLAVRGADVNQQQQQQHNLFSQASWGRLEMKPERNKFKVQELLFQFKKFKYIIA